MPLFKIDYDATVLSSQQSQELVTILLESSKKIFKTDDDHISIFTDKYDQIGFSTAIAEIECRAKVAEFDHPTMSRDEVREGLMEEYKKVLQKYIEGNKLDKGIVFTITFEDWQVIWVEGK